MESRLAVSFGSWALFAAAVACQEPAPPFDLVIAGASVVDGTGAEATVADLGIRDGRIAAIGDLGAAQAGRRLDAKGLVVAPGFIDVHAHVDSQILEWPQADNFLRMGVTTIVTGNCGGSVLELGKHFAAVEKQGVGPNYASLVGHGTVREKVLGSARRAPAPEELARMCALVEQAMADGAQGLSTGLIYVPGTYAETEEIIALAKVAGRHGGIYATHMRNEEDKVIDSIEEALRIGREGGLPVQLSHLKASGKPNWGRGREILDRIAKARSEGQTVTGDQYAYPASSTGLDVIFPSAALEGGRGRFAKRLADEPAFRAEMEKSLLGTMDRSGFGDLSYCRVTNAPNNPALAGLTLDAVAERRLGKKDREAQAKAAVDLFIEAKGQRVGMIYHKMSEADVATIMASEFVGVASDAGVVRGGRPHPRGSGNNARVLGRYVRELKVLTLPAAVRKMSSLPASAFRLEDRGRIAAGAWADLVVFDAATVADRATFEEPVEPPAGIRWVLVNGVVAVDGGEPTGLRPGHVLRRRAPERAGGG